MKREHIFLIFILFLTFLSIYLLYQILSPFLSSIVWAILLAMISYPLFKKLHNLLKKRGVLSALIMTLLVLVVIVLPLTLLMASLASDVGQPLPSGRENDQDRSTSGLFRESPKRSQFSNRSWPQVGETCRFGPPASLAQERESNQHVHLQSDHHPFKRILHICHRILLHPPFPLLSF